MHVTWTDHDSGVSVYQSRGYGEAASSTIDAEWGVIGDADGRWRLPLCISKIEGSGHFDAVSPYGYPGVSVDPGLTASDVARAWDSTLEALASRDIVSVFLRFAPYRRDVERIEGLPGLELVELSETVIIDLGDEDAMWNAMHGRARTAIRKAERAGLRARVVDHQPLVLRPGEGFRRVYDAAMDRVGASPAHRHKNEYYDRLTQADDVSMRLIEVTDEDGTVVSATLLLIDEDGVHYHLSGSIIEAARNGANNLLIWTAMRWAAEHGHEVFHLGGGTSRNDGLFRFKASFGGRALPFFVGRLIVEPRVYAHLVSERADWMGVEPRALEASGFFPAYRAVSA